MTNSQSVPLGYLCEFRYGKSLPASSRNPGPYPVFGSNGEVGTHDKSITNGPAIIVGRKGSVGALHFSLGPCWPIDTTYYVESSKGTDLRWLFRALSTLGLDGLNRAAAIPGLNRDDAYRKRLLLPPIEEQRRIAAILDQADALRAKRRETLTTLESLIGSAFTASFGDPRRWAQRWEIGRIADTVQTVNYGTSQKAGSDGTWPVLRMGNLTTTGRITLDDLKYLDLSDPDIARYTVRRGDILFNRTNSPELVGKTAVVRTDLPLAFAGYLIRVRTNARHNPEFVSGYLNSRHGKAVLRGMNKAIVGQANINAKELQSIPIALPPKVLQDEFADRVGAINTQREAAQRSLATLDELFASLQSRAFSGQL